MWRSERKRAREGRRERPTGPGGEGYPDARPRRRGGAVSPPCELEPEAEHLVGEEREPRPGEPLGTRTSSDPVLVVHRQDQVVALRGLPDVADHPDHRGRALGDAQLLDRAEVFRGPGGPGGAGQSER